MLTSPPQKILIIKPSAIGDIVHALPVLARMRRTWPDAKISWLVSSTCAGLLEGHPMLDDTIVFERRRFGKSWRDPSAAKGLWQFARDLRDARFDLVVDLQGLFRSGWLTGQTRAPTRVGFVNAREFGWLYYTDRVAVRSKEMHAVDRYLQLADALGCVSGPLEFPLESGEQERAWLASTTDRVGKYAVLLPGSNWETKRWPVEYFAALVKPLRQRFDLATIVTGGPDDIALAERIPADINLAGKTNLRQLVALLDGASLVIANDSGPMHIASALNKPLVTMYGPTNPVRTGPYGRMDTVLTFEIPCAPCYCRNCPDRSCLRWISVESVLRKAETQLSAEGLRSIATASA